MSLIKKFAFAGAMAVMLYSGEAANASTQDLTKWNYTKGVLGEVVLATNLASLTANSVVFMNVVGVTSFEWQFKANDYLPYNDFAYFSLNNTQTTLANVASVGDYGGSDWRTIYIDSPFTGTLSFGVFNVGDASQSSLLFIQNVLSVPEPETNWMLLLGLGVVLRRKYGRGAS